MKYSIKPDNPVWLGTAEEVYQKTISRMTPLMGAGLAALTMCDAFIAPIEFHSVNLVRLNSKSISKKVLVSLQ
jgi:hypothetical protein